MDANNPEYDDRSDDDGTNSETSDDVVEVGPNEFPGYFQERGNRLFHSHGRSPYPLPVDTAEQQRLNGLNALVRRLIGDHSVGPVRDLLALAPGEQRRVLDLGTGTGQWILDMAREFPHVRFYGVDIVPIATRYPPPNVTFEMHDIMEPSRYATGSIDMVHARSITLAVRDYRALVVEVARVLRRGGLFVSCEWARCLTMDDGSDVRSRAPRACAFFDAVREALRVRRGLESMAARIPQLLVDSRHFSHVEAKVYRVPIGDWSSDIENKEIGREFRESMAVYANSMYALLSEGPRGMYASALIEGFIRDIWSVPGLVSSYYTVHARRM
ncbi:S-adenosyl-L-methionine-dependent methyltransferase [Trametes polyzona]|nr:S-adenosyl-L-methionine-dependent methyltransferase [Trametes polyzona]